MQKEGETGGWGRESVGSKSSGQRSRFKRGSSAQETASGETTETDVGADRSRESKAGDPTQRNGSGVHRGLRENKERQRQGTNPGKGGAVKSGTWAAFGGPKERDPKGSRRSQRMGETPKEGKS